MIICAGVPSWGAAQNGDPLPVINAKLASTAPQIDGDLGDPAWRNASSVDSFQLYTGAKPASEQTKAYLLYDREKLYIAFICYDSNIRGLKSDDDVFKGDTVELFLDPGRSFEYTHVAVNPRGKVYFAWQIGDRKNDVKTATKVIDDRWQVEMAIPFKDIKMPGVKAGGVDWGINLCRTASRTKEASCWSPTLIGFHNPGRFGVLKGLNVDQEKFHTLQLAADESAYKGPISIETDRTFYSREGAMSVSVSIASGGTLAGKTLSIKAVDETGKTRLVRQVKPVLLTNSEQLDISSLPAGRYTLIASLPNTDGGTVSEAARIVYKVSAHKPLHSTVVRNGILYVDDKPYLPIAIYFGARWDKYKVLNAKDIDDIIAKGFNTIIPVWPFYKEDLLGREDIWASKDSAAASRVQIMKETSLTAQSILDTAEKKHVKVAGWMPYIWSGQEELSSARLEAGMKTILKYREHPAMLVWMSNDETDGWPKVNKRLYDLYKELDPDHPVWLNLIGALASNREAADILSTDPYPIGKAPITKVSAHVDTAREILGKNSQQSFWTVLQMFGSPPEGWPRCPNPAEERCMTFLALNHGSRGLAYFAYAPEVSRQEGGDKWLSEELWKYMAELNRQIQEMSLPYLLGKDIKDISGTDKELDIAAREYEGNVYVIVCNTTDKEVKAGISCTEQKLSGEAEVLFEDRKVILQNGLINDIFSGYAVHIYVLRKGDGSEK